ncbi:hypothetical protein CROQUDRAFT_51576, partial [Cronartium quercuum f. sp. fusiforme G11]
QVTLQTAPMQQLVTLHVTLQPRSEACARRYICSVTALPVVPLGHLSDGRGRALPYKNIEQID